MALSARKLNKGFRGSFRGVAVFAILLAAVILLCGWYMYGRRALPDGAIRLYFVDVGQGDASLIVTPEGAVLIDAGLSGSEETLYHTLRRTGQTLAYLVITHPHDDHMGGASYILERMDVENIILPADTSDIAEYGKFLAAVEAEGAAVLYAAADLTFALGGAEFTCLAPFTDTGDLNENSAILRMEYGNFSALFTGDAGALSESLQLEKYGGERGGMLDADILKVGHHGSDGSSTAEYLAAVTPKYAVISCGENNSYGHPDPDLLDRLADAGAEILRTDEEGTVIVTVEEDVITVTNTSAYSSDGSIVLTAGKDLEGKNYDPRKFLKPGFDAIVKRAKDLIRDFGSEGKGWA